MIERLSLTHLRIDIEADSNLHNLEMETCASHCLHLGLPSELAIYFTADYEAEIQLITKVLRATQIPVSTFLIYRKIRLLPLLRQFPMYHLLFAHTVPWL